MTLGKALILSQPHFPLPHASQPDLGKREGTAQLALGSLKEAEVAGSGQAPGHALLSARWGRSPRAPVHSPFAWQQGSQDIREGTGTVEGGELRERVGEERGPVASGGKSPVQNWGQGKGR